MTGKTVWKVEAVTARGVMEPILKNLRTSGVIHGHMAAGRSITLEEKKGFFGLGARSAIMESPVEITTFLVNSGLEAEILSTVAREARLDIPGRGSIYSERVTLLRTHDLCAENTGDASVEVRDLPVHPELMGICGIVQRGRGDLVARVALDTGTCVPAITFGTGTGLRDKLGLLRIAVPADKEVIALASSVHDADIIMNLMIESGGLHLPGRGFIYQFPIERGIVNSKIMRGMPRQAASIEQIISALDSIKGGARWRSRSAMASESGNAPYPCLYDHRDLGLVCNEGRAEDLVAAAMAAGAPGATIRKLKHVRPQDSAQAGIPAAREVADMIVAEQQIPPIVEALEKAGAFDDNTHGMLYSRPVPKACTYLKQ